MRASSNQPERSRSEALWPLTLLFFILAAPPVFPGFASTGAATPPAPASEAGSASITLSPAVVMLKGRPGQSTTQRLTITNRTAREFTFELVARDVAVRDGQRVFVPAGELAGSIAATAVFSEPEIVVAPGQSASVRVTLTVPATSNLRAVVAFFRGRQKPAVPGEVALSASLGSLLTFTLSDNIRAEAGPIEFHASTLAANARFSQRLANTGSEPVVAGGVVAVISEDGRLAGRAPFPPQRLLPGQRLTLTAEYPAELPAGRHRVVTTIEFEGRAITNSAEITVP